jgi:hypothetical protein
MARVALWSSVPLWEVHHAETVDLAWFHSDRGDSIHYLWCKGFLPSCPANSTHDLARCVLCRRQSRYTMDKLLPPGTTVVPLDLPKVHLRHSAPTSESEMRDFTLMGVPFGEMVLSQLVDDTCELHLSDETLQTRGQTLLASAVSLFLAARKYFEDFKIDTVYAWNGRRPSDGPVLWAAKDLGLSYHAHITGGQRDRLLILPATRVHDARIYRDEMDRVITEGLETLGREKVERIGRDYFSLLPQGSIETIGHERFVDNWVALPRALTESPKPLLVYFTGSPFERAYMSDSHGEVEDFSDEFNIIERLSQEVTIRSRYQVVVRWHPNLRSSGPRLRSQIESCIARSAEAFHIRAAESLDSHALARQAAVVVSTGSTMGIEAAAAGGVSILLGEAYYMRRAGLYRPRDWSDLLAILDSSPQAITPSGGLEFGFHQLNFGNYSLHRVKLDETGRAHVGQARIRAPLLRRLDKVLRLTKRGGR